MDQLRHDCFRSLYDKYYGRVFAFFRRKGFLREDSRELAQDTFLRVFKYMDRYRGDSEWTYIFTIANSIYLNRIRLLKAKMRDVPTSSLEELPDRSVEERGNPFTGKKTTTPEEETLQKERVSILRQAIEGLPPRMRRCLQLQVYGGLKYREIAVVMGTTIDAVKRLLYEARNRLRVELEGRLDRQFQQTTGE